MPIEIITEGLRPDDDLLPGPDLFPSGYKVLNTDEPDLSDLKLGQYDMGGFKFGTRSPFAVPNNYLVNSFDEEQGEISTVDSSMPDEDGTMFGVDTHGGMNLTFRINLWKKGQPALDDLSRIKRAWNSPHIRKYANRITYLRMNKNNRTRIVYGRPRRFKPTYGKVELGWAPIDCDFKCVNEYYYDNEQSVHSVSLANLPTAGFTIPFTSPFALATYRPFSSVFYVNGDAPTWPTWVLRGPCVNPTVEIVGLYKFSLNVSLLSNDYITIDSRPWFRSTRLNGVRNRAGRYTAESVTLPDMEIPPGKYALRYSAVDQTLSSSVTLGWRNAHHSP